MYSLCIRGGVIITPAYPSISKESNMETIKVKWVKVRYGDRPIAHAVQGGTLAEQPVYIGRVYIDRVRADKSLVPGRVIGNGSCSYVPPDTKYGECRDSNYDILVCPNTAEAFDWVTTTGDNIPSNAVEGGYKKPGEPYYIGRIRTGEGMDIVHGRVDPRAGVLTLASGFDYDHPQITTYSEFEILVLKDKAEIIEEISQQTLCNVRYNTSHEAVKHTIVPNVALANVPVRNTSSSVQKVKASTSFLITETFSWSDNVPQSNSSLKTVFKCGVPYFSFKDDAIYVTPIAVLPEQILPSDQIVYTHYPRNVLPQVTSGRLL